MKKLLIAILGLTLVMILAQSPVKANGIPYSTFTYSQTQNQVIHTQDAYIPISVDKHIGGVSLSRPEDIYIDQDDNIFIADTGNGRIIKYDLNTDEVMIIGEGILREPKGVHVGFDNHLYVADFGHKQGYKFVYNETINNYEVEQLYKRPVNSPYFTETDTFEPTKIITDKGHNVYLLLSANINGLAEFKNDGIFFGYFGGNRLPNTFENTIKSLLFDEQQRRDWFKMIPKPVYNIAVDQNGLIITVTKGEPGYLKLNIANHIYSESIWGRDTLEDITVGPNNTLFAVGEDGYIMEYTEEGDLLFIFSGHDASGKKGLFNNPGGIAVDSKNNIYVIDQKNSDLQIFSPTLFANLIHEAITYYQAGLYAQSREPWEEVLKMNSLFDVANKGLGDAYFAEGDYEKAMIYYEVSRDVEGYSNAYWEVRNTSLLKSAPILIYVLLGLLVIYILNIFLKFMKYVKLPFQKVNAYLVKFKLYNELKYNFEVMKNPADGFYGIKRQNKTSNLSAFIMLMLFFFSYLLFIFYTKFTFNNRIVSEINLVQQIIFIFVPFILWVFGNYLVCSIRDGEGSFKDVFHGTAYSLLPLTITFPILVVISQYLTLNEGFIYTTILIIGFIVTGVYLVVMVKDIHFYDFKPTVGNILISIFTALMILVMVMIVYILFNEVIQFFLDIIREVTSRA